MFDPLWRSYCYAAGLDPDDKMIEAGWIEMLHQAYLHGQNDAINGDLEEDPDARGLQF